MDNKKGYIEITDELDLSLGKSLTDFILEAQKEAIKNDIRANTVMISKKLAKVKGFVHIFGDGGYGEFPPLICGLEAYVTDELPEEFAFGLLEAPYTQRKQSYEDGYKAGYQAAMNKIREMTELGADEEA
jgi:hypothetical protein